MQMKRDEQFARELQEEENRIARSEGRQIPKVADLYGNLDSIIQKEEKKTSSTTTPPQLFSANNGVLKNNTKKARPQPAKAASIQIDAKTLVNAKDSFDDAFKSSTTSTSENKFDDDAWAPKDLTPSLVPTVKASTVKAPTPPPPPPPPPPPTYSVPQTTPSIPIRPSNLSSANLSPNSSTPIVNQNQISPRLPTLSQSTSSSPNTPGQLNINSWNSTVSNSNMSIQSSQPTPPPIPPPLPQQSVVVPLNSALHPPLIPTKSNNMNNNTQGNNMLNTMNIQRSNSASSFQGMEAGNLPGPGGNFNSSMSTWSSTSKLNLALLYIIL